MNKLIKETKRIWLTAIGCIVFTMVFTIAGCKLILYVDRVCNKIVADFVISAVALFFAFCLFTEIIIAKKIMFKEES